jgi:hypothetical protein
MALIRTGHGPDDWAPLPGEARARGRITTSSGIFGGPIIVPRKPLLSNITKRTPTAPYVSRPSGIPRCGKPLRNGPNRGEPCHRRAGHSAQEGCRSKAAVERDNGRRRTRDFGR